MGILIKNESTPPTHRSAKVKTSGTVNGKHQGRSEFTPATSGAADEETYPILSSIGALAHYPELVDLIQFIEEDRKRLADEYSQLDDVIDR